MNEPVPEPVPGFSAGTGTGSFTCTGKANDPVLDRAPRRC